MTLRRWISLLMRATTVRLQQRQQQQQHLPLTDGTSATGLVLVGIVIGELRTHVCDLNTRALPMTRANVRHTHAIRLPENPFTFLIRRRFDDLCGMRVVLGGSALSCCYQLQIRANFIN
jgi:hypothetical protein